jgi:guanylate kinase
MPDQAIVAILVMFVGLPFIITLPISIFIWTRHKYRLEELRQQKHTSTQSDMVAQMEALRNEMHSLRDTTMQYDMSFDTALQRMESRVQNLERARNETQGIAAQGNRYAGD